MRPSTRKLRRRTDLISRAAVFLLVEGYREGSVYSLRQDNFRSFLCNRRRCTRSARRIVDCIFTLSTALPRHSPHSANEERAIERQARAGQVSKLLGGGSSGRHGECIHQDACRGAQAFPGSRGQGTVRAAGRDTARKARQEWYVGAVSTGTFGEVDGANAREQTALPEDPPTPIWELILEQFKDQLVIILLGSAAVSFVLALFEDGEGWTAFVDPAVVCIP